MIKKLLNNLERQIENQNRNEEEYQIQKEMNQHKITKIIHGQRFRSIKLNHF